MSATRIGAGLLVVLLASACGSTAPAATPTATPTADPSPTSVVGQGSADPGGPGGPGAPGGQTAGPGGPGAAGGQTAGPGGPGPGGPGGSILSKWDERAEVIGGDTSSVITQQYAATVDVTLTQVDIGSWTLTGTADITSSYTSDFEAHFTTPLGPCNQHYTDAASAVGSVDVEGGLEARDGFYQFYVNIGGLDGANDTVRDDSGCNGTTTQETTPWSVAPVFVGESGAFSGTHFSGSTSEPREGGAETLTWDFTITE